MGWFSRKPTAPAERKFASFMLGMGSAQMMSRDYRTLAEEGYALNAVVHACVTKIANAVASPDLFVYRKDKKGNVQKLESHPLDDLLDKPNPAMSGRQFRAALASFHRVGGNAYVHGFGVEQGKRPVTLQLLDPAKMTVKAGSTIFPASYEYHPSQQTVVYPVDQLTGASDILHIKTFNPLDPWYGLAPMTAAANSVDTFNSGSKWNKKLIDNECRPPGALTMEGKDGSALTLTDEQYSRLRSQIDEQMTGANNAGRPFLLEGGLKWQQLGMNPRDMDFKENMLMAARFTASVFGVPPQLLNIPGESTYANYEQAEVSFWANTALPLLGSYLDDLNRWLAPCYGDDVFVWYDEEMIPALEPLRNAKSTRINASGFMTINEKREAMGLESVDGGDVVLVQSSTIPLELAGGVDLAEQGSPVDMGQTNGDGE